MNFKNFLLLGRIVLQCVGGRCGDWHRLPAQEVIFVDGGSARLRQVRQVQP
jgi:hypothetical protein